MEECYASDAFAGRVDTDNVGCVREDDIYEDEDPNAEGMDSGKNNESSSKNVQNVAVFRPVTGRSLPSRSGRERDEIYGYGPKFARDRFQDRSFGRSRGDFMHGRDRGWGWGRGWYSGRDFECYGGAADYLFRHKHTTPAWESANECNDYDGAAFGTNRRRSH
ncbi:hypothetical protein KY290_020646 [Solanum tuberosum]|uniref:Btz domain-containing protein n=1 Tax=Solanum tuberosum TaxID=4113 RepID=A0ABQ7V090_SOLTU|nr:hypothetical protein KY290_020646 [Solanum tuberosum]